MPWRNGTARLRPSPREQKTHDADHRRAAVKDLGLEAAGLRLGALLGEPVEGVVQVELDLATNAALDGQVVARLAALGVVDL